MTIWIARFLGPIIFVVSIPMMFTPVGLQETTKRFLADSPLVLISGILAMVGGLAMVNTHNVWVMDWPVIITLFGWALAVGGAVRIIAPRAVDQVGGAMMDHPIITRIAGAVWAALGAFLTIKGYL